MDTDSCFKLVLTALMCVLVASVVLAAWHQPAVQEAFQSALTYDDADIVVSEEGYDDEYGEDDGEVTATKKVCACWKEEKAGDDILGKYAPPDRWKASACLKTYEDPSVAPVFLDDTWAAPDQPMQIGSMLPTFRFEED